MAAAISCGCAADPDSGAIDVVFAAEARDVEGWAMSSDGALLATIENDRGYAVLRVGSWTAPGQSSLGCRAAW